MANIVAPSDIADFLTDAAWALTGTKYEIIGNRNTKHENKSWVNWDYKIGDKVLLCKEDILHKSESTCHWDPLTKSRVHTNGTIRVQRRTNQNDYTLGE
eukprot:CCRYP_016126-RA/>CCRYP_016126-RA protein AED:0.50 eAED:0.42 QI:0/0/0/1/0/0/2/0/98